MGNSPTRPDGRHARSERARAAVVDALLELIEEGDLRPTADRIAARAGVSLRLVFHHFRDLEVLFSSAAERQMQRILPTLRPVPSEGPLPKRIRSFVTERTSLLERMKQVRRAALLVEPFSAEIAQRLEQARALKRMQVEFVFGSELAGRPEAERRALVASLAAVSSFSAWEELRQHQGLEIGAARKAMVTLITLLLGPTPG